MKMNFIVFVISLLALSACGQNRNDETMRLSREKYEEAKKQFDSSFIAQFPAGLQSRYFSITNCQAAEYNNVGLYLFEQELPDIFLDSLDSELQRKSIATYESSDTCLFVISHRYRRGFGVPLAVAFQA